jgi:hypothetical protein
MLHPVVCHRQYIIWKNYATVNTTKEHKNSAITYLINRMTTYRITYENKIIELSTINEILANNHYRQHRNSTVLAPKTRVT